MDVIQSKISNVKRCGKIKIPVTKTLLILISFIFSFLVLFIFIQGLRQGIDTIIFDLLIIRIKAYFFGYLSAFTIWFDSIEDIFQNSMFMSTFAGPLNLFGLINRDLGFYAPISINNEVSTNIFTVFRSIISDLTIFGSLATAFFIGFIFQFWFQRKKKSPI